LSLVNEDEKEDSEFDPLELMMVMVQELSAILINNVVNNEWVLFIKLL
jgi:hypothetical protein